MVQVKADVHYFLRGKTVSLISFTKSRICTSSRWPTLFQQELAPKMSNKVESQSKDNLPPLHQAIMKSDRSEISRLLAENTDIEARDDQGRTALHLAALLGFEDLVQLLLKAEANTEVKDYEDMTPLHYASWYLHQGVVKLLT
jgi:ankyrin repeat protein